MIRYRLNVINIDNIADFARIRGQRSGETGQVYMVKFVGANADTAKNIRELKLLLNSEQALGRIYYKYIGSLDIGKDYSRYQKAYEDWVNLNKRHIDLDIIKSHILNEWDLINALAQMEDTLYRYKKDISTTIVKNIIIKLLYWLEEKFVGEDIKIPGDRSIKIVCENIIKESQIYFFVFLNLLGMDVCMLQYSCDTDIMGDYFHIKRLGNFCQCDSIWRSIPEEIKKGKPNEEKVKKEIKKNTSPVIISFESTRKKSTKTQKEEAPASSIAPPRIESPTQVVIPPRRESTATRLPEMGKGSGFTANKNKELNYVELAKLSVSIVMIKIYDRNQRILGTGSGIMIGKDGFILTNCHVINGGDLFEVRIEDDNETYKTTEVIKYNHHLDLAIIRIPRVLKPLRLYLGKEALVRGQKVVAIGSPLGLFNSVSDGIISGFRNIENVDMIQFSAPISPGSSGGAVLNMYGEVIGISTAGFSEGQNINLAVPYMAIWDFARGFIR